MPSQGQMAKTRAMFSFVQSSWKMPIPLNEFHFEFSFILRSWRIIYTIIMHSHTLYSIHISCYHSMHPGMLNCLITSHSMRLIEQLLSGSKPTSTHLRQLISFGSYFPNFPNSRCKCTNVTLWASKPRPSNRNPFLKILRNTNTQTHKTLY